MPVRTMDGLVFQQGFPPSDVVMIDVEGLENAVLNGALAVLKKFQPAVIFEDCPGHSVTAIHQSESSIC